MKQDPALQPGGRGDRKVLVTELYPRTEEEATKVVWRAGSLKCPVQLMSDTECAVFSHQAHQDRHFHKQSTEIYMLLEGKMNIEVEGEAFELAAGDMIVVNPGAFHEVRPAGTEFLVSSHHS